MRQQERSSIPVVRWRQCLKNHLNNGKCPELPQGKTESEQVCARSKADSVCVTHNDDGSVNDAVDPGWNRTITDFGDVGLGVLQVCNEHNPGCDERKISQCMWDHSAHVIVKSLLPDEAAVRNGADEQLCVLNIVQGPFAFPLVCADVLERRVVQVVVGREALLALLPELDLAVPDGLRVRRPVGDGFRHTDIFA